MINSFNISMLVMALVGMPILLLVLHIMATKTGLVDVPNARKIHSKPIPIIGGIALFIVSLVLMTMTKNVSLFGFYLMLATGLVVAIGLLDDIYDLRAIHRFAVQIFACLVIIYFTDIKIETFGFLLSGHWELKLGVLAVPVTVFGVVGVINALNMADGIDGLASVTFILPVLTLVSLSQFNDFSFWLCMVLLSVAIFMVFNKSTKYKIFLGDNGSLFLGFLLAWLLVFFSQGQDSVIYPVTALYLVAIPVYDTIFVMIKRIRQGKSPFDPDRSHLHHYFLKIGHTQSQTLLVIILMQISMILLGLALLKFSAQYLQFYIFVILSAVYYFIMKKLWSTKIHQ